MPLIVIFLGQGHTFKVENITLERLDKIKRHKVKMSPEIAVYYDQLYDLLGKHLHYFAQSQDKPN